MSEFLNRTVSILATFLMIAVLCLVAGLTTAAEKTITNEDVTAMVKAGLTDSAIIAAIRRAPSRFDLGPTALVKFRQDGVSNAVIEVMLESPPRSSSGNRGIDVPNSTERDRPSVVLKG